MHRSAGDNWQGGGRWHWREPAGDAARRCGAVSTETNTAVSRRGSGGNGRQRRRSNATVLPPGRTRQRHSHAEDAEDAEDDETAPNSRSRRPRRSGRNPSPGVVNSKVNVEGWSWRAMERGSHHPAPASSASFYEKAPSVKGQRGGPA